MVVRPIKVTRELRLVGWVAAGCWVFGLKGGLVRFELKDLEVESRVLVKGLGQVEGSIGVLGLMRFGLGLSDWVKLFGIRVSVGWDEC